MIWASRKGQPLAALALLFAVWAGARSWLWESPFAASVLAPGSPVAARNPVAEPDVPFSLPAQSLAGIPSVPVAGLTVPFSPPAPLAWPQPHAQQVFAPIAPVEQSAPPPLLAPRVGGGHQMLWMAAMSQLPLPASVSAVMDTQVASPQTRPPAPRQWRWSADGWLLWRDGGTGFNLPGAGLPGASVPVGTYGASQYGAVLRYRLAPGSGHRPTVYLRGTGSVDRPRYQEVALGLAVRPVPQIPVAATAELRATRSFGQTRLRPAVSLVTELAPVKLPLGAQAEAYVQAGYVGGTGATTFIDGQLRVDRPVARFGPAELRAGGGAWGGAQEGARRLDVGPSATLGFPAGGALARLSADWRFRLAGRAAPSSGPAITLSAGF